MSGFQAPAAAYDRFVGRYSGELAEAFCDAIGVGGGRALDVGAGPGALARALLGRGFSVAAVEPSQTFAAALRERLPAVDVHEVGAEALPFGDGEFDVTAAQLVVNFLADPPAGVREMRRVTRPRGVVAAAVWDYGGGMTMLRAFWDAAATVDPEARGRDELHMRYRTPETLGGLLRECGLQDVEVRPLDVSAGYDDFDDLWAPLEAGVGPAGAYAAGLDDERRTLVRDELRRRLAAGDGPFTLAARAWCAVGIA
jgi:SAM-dependent methyltransferase